MAEEYYPEFLQENCQSDSRSLLRFPRLLKWYIDQGNISPETLDYLSKEACILGDLEIVQLLFEYGADSDQSENFVEAISNGRTEIVKFLLAEGGDPWDPEDLAIVRAVNLGYWEMLRILPVDSTDLFNKACRYGHVNMIRALASTGFNAPRNDFILNLGYENSIELEEYFDELEMFFITVHEDHLQSAIEGGDIRTARTILNWGVKWTNDHLRQATREKDVHMIDLLEEHPESRAPVVLKLISDISEDYFFEFVRYNEPFPYREYSFDTDRNSTRNEFVVKILKYIDLADFHDFIDYIKLNVSQLLKFVLEVGRIDLYERLMRRYDLTPSIKHFVEAFGKSPSIFRLLLKYCPYKDQDLIEHLAPTIQTGNWNLHTYEHNLSWLMEERYEICVFVKEAIINRLKDNQSGGMSETNAKNILRFSVMADDLLSRGLMEFVRKSNPEDKQAFQVAETIMCWHLVHGTLEQCERYRDVYLKFYNRSQVPEWFKLEDISEEIAPKIKWLEENIPSGTV